MTMRRLYSAAAAVIITAAAQNADAVCLRSYTIDHTEIKSDTVIMFHMKDGTTYRNTLPQRCVGLKTAINGFTYTPSNPTTQELCDNLDTFRLNDGTGQGRTCFFGAFTKLS